MKQFCLTALWILFCSSLCFGQGGQSDKLYYLFPESVERLLRERIRKDEQPDSTTFLVLSTISKDTFSLEVAYEWPTPSGGCREIKDVTKSDRLIVLGHKIFPLFFGHDFEFVMAYSFDKIRNFGIQKAIADSLNEKGDTLTVFESPPSLRTVILTLDGPNDQNVYTIVFTRQGKIISEGFVYYSRRKY